MNYEIKVKWQAARKIISGAEIVNTNRWIDSSKRVDQLKEGDEFCYNGAWYIIEEINKID